MVFLWLLKGALEESKGSEKGRGAGVVGVKFEKAGARKHQPELWAQVVKIAPICWRRVGF